MLRQFFWIYPLINAGHILGVALLMDAILPMDARLLGAWPGLPVATLEQVLLTGCALAIISGSLLFIVQPIDYTSKPLFWAKMALVLLALLNALALRWTRT